MHCPRAVIKRKPSRLLLFLLVHFPQNLETKTTLAVRGEEVWENNQGHPGVWDEAAPTRLKENREVSLIALPGSDTKARAVVGDGSPRTPEVAYAEGNKTSLFTAVIIWVFAQDTDEHRYGRRGLNGSTRRRAPWDGKGVFLRILFCFNYFYQARDNNFAALKIIMQLSF